MKKNTKKNIIICAGILILIAIVAVIIVCINKKKPIEQNEAEQALVGSWAYIHDKETTVLKFGSNGSAEFEGKSYTYKADGSFIELTGSKDSLKLRYAQKGDNAYFYIQGNYVPDGTENKGIIGAWVEPDKNWTFEFTDKGTFMEEGSLTGHYEADEAAGTIKLMYGAAMQDTVLYYSLNGDKLFIEYPWGAVKIK